MLVKAAFTENVPLADRGAELTRPFYRNCQSVLLEQACMLERNKDNFMPKFVRLIFPP
jgi:hypothetical protein